MQNSTPKVIVYTAIFGNYECVKEPVYRDKSIDYLLFTDDKNIQSDNWRTEVIERKDLSPRRMSRLPKILSHTFLPEHDISIYLDSNFQLKTKNVYQMITECFEGHDIALYRHAYRNCTYEEIDACITYNVENEELANQVRNKYLKEGLPKKIGLFENGFIIRNNSTQIKQLNEMWFQEYMTGSERDQFSLMYCLWKLGITANPIKVGNQIRINPYLNFYNQHGL